MIYIAFLRGINVGGQKRVKMTDLQSLFSGLGCRNVRTYIQSGNVVFDHDSSNGTELAAGLENKIIETFGFPVRVILRTDIELCSIISNNPFARDPAMDRDKLHLTLMTDTGKDTASLSDIKKDEEERYLVLEKEIYLYCPKGYGNTKLNNAVFEKKLRTVATTRNWKTIIHLMEMV